MQPGLLPFGLPVLGEEFRQSVLRHVGDAIEDVREPGLGVDVVELRGADQRVHSRCSRAAAIAHESLAIRVRRKLSSTDVIDVLTDLFILRDIPTWIRSDNGPEFVAEAVRPVDRRGGGPHRLHRAGIALGERLHREFQCPTARRAPERGDILHSEGSPGSHRIVAVPLQRDPPTWQPGIPAAGPRDDCLAKLAARLRYAPPATQLGRGSRNALTFNLDESPGAGQSKSGRFGHLSQPNKVNFKWCYSDEP